MHPTTPGLLPAVKNDVQLVAQLGHAQHLQRGFEVVRVEEFVLAAPRVERQDEELRAVDAEHVEGEVVGAVQDGELHAGVGAVEVGAGAPDGVGGGVGEGAVQGRADGVGFAGEDGADAELELCGGKRGLDAWGVEWGGGNLGTG